MYGVKGGQSRGYDWDLHIYMFINTKPSMKNQFPNQYINNKLKPN